MIQFNKKVSQKHVSSSVVGKPMGLAGTSLKSLIVSFYRNKYRSCKLGNFNLINLLFTLSNSVNRAALIQSSLQLMIFDKIISG